MLQDPISKPAMENSRGGSGAGTDQNRRSKANSVNSEQVLKCPRCDSLNTKFCYYNNYSLAQPRHFCKNCRRYWTQGGSLRNVPIGGGCRKNKRVKSRTVDPQDLFGGGLGIEGHHHSGLLPIAEGASCSGAVPGNFMPAMGAASCFTPIMPPGLMSDLVSPVDGQYQLLSMAFSRLQQEALTLNASTHERHAGLAAGSTDVHRPLSDLLQQSHPAATLFDGNAGLHTAGNAYARPEHHPRQQLATFSGSDMTTAGIFEHSGPSNPGLHLMNSSFRNANNTGHGLASSFSEQQRSLYNSFETAGTQAGTSLWGSEAQMPDTYRFTVLQQPELQHSARHLTLELGASEHRGVQIDPITHSGGDTEDCGSRSAQHQRYIEHVHQKPQLTLPEFENQESPSAVAGVGRGRVPGPDMIALPASAINNVIRSAANAVQDHAGQVGNMEQLSWRQDLRACRTHAAGDEQPLQLATFGAATSENNDQQRPAVPTAAFSHSPVAYSREPAHVSFWNPASSAAGAWTPRHDVHGSAIL